MWGGDFYDVIYLHDDRVGLAIADVSDKGCTCRALHDVQPDFAQGRRHRDSGPGPGLGGRSITCSTKTTMPPCSSPCCTRYTIRPPGELTYANGGHNSPLVVHSDGSSSLLPLTSGIALGVVPGLEFLENTVVLSPGDTVIFYTDGVTEAMDDDGEEFGTQRLFEIFADGPPERLRGGQQCGLRGGQGLCRGHSSIGRYHLHGALSKGERSLSGKLSLKIEPRAEELDTITAAVEEFGDAEEWPGALIFRVNLVLEELGLNNHQPWQDRRSPGDRDHSDLGTGIAHHRDRG